jgi:hypothetical protein
MTTHSTHEVTRLLVAWSDGDEAALEKLMPLVYEELRQLAKIIMRREQPGHASDDGAGQRSLSAPC